jgi:dihydropteroate synthase
MERKLFWPRRTGMRRVLSGLPRFMLPSTSFPILPTALASPWPKAPEPRALIMGIVNVTPDSFSDGGQFWDHAIAIRHAQALDAEGADILDIGGESTRPGAAEVTEAEEARRVLPVIEALMTENPARTISIDTYKATTARAALKLGARIVNDVWALRDPAMAETVVEFSAGLVLMHNRGWMAPDLDIVADMERYFEHSLNLAARAGIPFNRIALDPGIGFGKTLAQNLAAIRALPRLKAFGCASLLGISRKSFLGLITGKPVGERFASTIAADCFGLLVGADVIRVHDVAAHRDAARVIAALAAPAGGTRS